MFKAFLKSFNYFQPQMKLEGIRNFCTNLPLADFWSGSFKVQWPWKPQGLHWIFPRDSRKGVISLRRFPCQSVCHLSPSEGKIHSDSGSKTNYRKKKWSPKPRYKTCVLLSPLERATDEKQVGNTRKNPFHIDKPPGRRELCLGQGDQGQGFLCTIWKHPPPVKQARSSCQEWHRV